MYIKKVQTINEGIFNSKAKKKKIKGNLKLLK